jgi:hypothetical protein
MSKALDKQTLEFAGKVLQNLPQMEPDIMQGWISNPGALKKVLAVALIPPSEEEFPRNEHGHILLTVVGLDLTGEEENGRLTDKNYRIDDSAKSCLMSTKKDSYDKNHRLVAGKEYTIALMPTKEIERDVDRTTDSLRKRGLEKYGYEKPLAGIALRIREAVSDEQMERMGFWYISVPHDPIKDTDGDLLVLGPHRTDGGRSLNAFWNHCVVHWRNNGAFAFLVS